MARSMSSLSTEYVWASITESSAADISAATVQLAVVAYGTAPAEDDWATPDATDTATAGTYRAAILVGPLSGLALTEGNWSLWYRLTDTPERPAAKAGDFRITP